MLDKTVDFFEANQYIGTAAFSEEINFSDLVGKYIDKKGYSRILIRQWKKGEEIKSHNITFSNQI